MSAYRPYPKTKPSGVEWLGDLPEGWKISRIGRLAFTGMGQTILREMLEEEASADALPVYSASEAEAEFGYFMNPSVRLSSGDLVVGARGSIGQTRRISAPSTCTQTTIWVKPIQSQIESAYLYWCMTGGREQLFPFDKTAIPMLTVEQVRSGGIPVPPLPEQIQIAAFLDRECGKLDALQAKQERLIELLKEKRQVLISHAVTRGLDPTAKLKHSGIESLGDAPEHWEISQPRFVCRHSGGGTPSKDNPLFWNGDIPWVSPKDMKRDIIEDSIDHITMEAVSQSATNLIPVGAILMVVRGMILLHSVPVAITAAPVTVNQDMKALICGKRLNSRFFLLLLKGLRDAVLDLVDASGHGTRCMKFDDFLRMGIPLPPLAEQRAIVAHLDEKCGKIDQLKAKAERGIELLKERRSALISAAVTGKIDVREN